MNREEYAGVKRQLGDVVFYAYRSPSCGLGDRVIGPLKITGIQTHERPNAIIVFCELEPVEPRDGTPAELRNSSAIDNRVLFADRKSALEHLESR